MEITGKTRVMFVLADPVGHVRASAVINAYFGSIGEDVAASPLHVAAADLGRVLDGIRAMRNVAGFGVTIPHKIAVLAHLDEVMPAARRIGAVNFVKRDEDGRLIGDNLDGVGFIAGLRTLGTPDHEFSVEGKRVLQLGAGGAGRATAFAMAEARVGQLTIMNRDLQKAQDLVDELAELYPALDISASALGSPAFVELDLLVNTTSLGMKTDDPLPIDLDGIQSDTAVCDIIVNPPVTRLMSEARARGAQAIGGQAMLDEQMALVARMIRR